MTIDYKQAGVDVAAGDALVDWLQSTQVGESPHKDKIVSGIGGFAALFRADFKDMTEPCLVSCTDGVGTKVKLAAESGRYKEVAQDLVAMCVNDLICCGGQPLFFLDYYASGKLELKAAQEFLAGVRSACIESDCALIGGETAEMPGVYAKNDFDCAGFAVGVVDKVKALGPAKVKVGDCLLGLPSSGFHSNGFSLLRKLFQDDLSQWMDRLLVPTALYVQVVKQMLKGDGVHALAHITGGGMENLPRILPAHTCAAILPWSMPEGFREVRRRSGMTLPEMLGTLNCGVGMVAVVARDQVAAVKDRAAQAGYKTVLDLGEVVAQKEVEGSWRLAEGHTWQEFER